LEKIRSEKASNRLEVVGIAVDIADDVRKYLAAQPIEYPI